MNNLLHLNTAIHFIIMVMFAIFGLVQSCAIFFYLYSCLINVTLPFIFM